jgi:hypothetical protein
MRTYLYRFYLYLRNLPSARKYLHLVPLPVRRLIVSKIRDRRAHSETLDIFDLDLPTRKFAEACIRVKDIEDRWRYRDDLIVEELVVTQKKSTYILEKDTTNASFVTSDLWDTLIGRVRPAEATKRQSALLISFMDWQNSNFNTHRISSCEIHKTRNETETTIYHRGKQPEITEVISQTLKNLKIFGLDPKQIVQFEIDQEIENSYVINSVLDPLSLDLKMIISDHYYSGKILQEICNALFEFERNDDFAIYSSADFGVTKSMDGKLFLAVMDSAQMKDWEHVGDNPWSDIECAKKHGAKTSLVTVIPGSSWNMHDLHIDLMSRDMSNSLCVDDLGRYLCDVATISYGLIGFAIEEALAHKANKVLYLSREGEFLSGAHKLLNKHLSKYSIPLLEPVHLPCSRSSILLASFGPDRIIEALEEISLQYPRMTVRTFCSTVGLSFELTNQIMESRIFSSTTLYATKFIYSDLLGDFVSQITDEVASNRIKIVSLLNQLEIIEGGFVVCDVGWRGSIQDALERIIEKRILGIYLGLRKPFNRKGFIENKKGLVFDEMRDQPASAIYDFVGPIERAFTLTDRQVSGYGISSDGSIVPIYSQNKEKIADWRFQAHQDHFEMIFNAVSSKWLSSGIFGSESKAAVSSALENWFLNPNIYHSDLWFSEKHGEEFGAGDNVHYLIEEPNKKWLSKAGKKEVLRAVRLSAWPLGYIRWISSGLGI